MMKFKYLVALAAALTSLTLGGIQTIHAEDAKTIRVISYNIEWFPGKRRNATPAEAEAHLELLQGEIKRLNPDVLLAQEIGYWQAFADLVSIVPGLQPAVLSAFTSEESGEYWSQQLGIASKLPVFAAWSEPWSAGEQITPRRGFSAAAVQVPDSDKLILFYDVHLKSNRSRNDEEAQVNFDTRDESVRQLLAHVERMETVVFPDRVIGVVVAGDFNTNQDGQFGDHVMTLMEAGGFYNTWGDTPRADRLTWRGSDRFEPVTFDHIFVKGFGKPKAELIEMPDGRSDHWPLGVDLTIP